MQKNILLVTNYRADRQYSMLKFGSILESYSHRIEDIVLEEIYPKVIVGKFNCSKLLKKWSGYIDKYIIFRNTLRNKILKNNINFKLAHIIDQSNSIYQGVLKNNKLKTLITCHDLIAIRTAKKDIKGAPRLTSSGTILQNRIFHSLQMSDHFCCDSVETLKDLNRLIPNTSNQTSIIHLGTNLPNKDDSQTYAFSKRQNEVLNKRFILHVGSAAWYKNRSAIFKLFKNFSRAKRNHDLGLVIVGPVPQNHELDKETALHLKNNLNNILILENIQDSLIKFLYKNASALVFPSIIEGFGWPPLEASQYKCPVITTKTGAIFEILKDNAYYVNPHDEEQILKTLLLILDKKVIKYNRINIPTYSECAKNYFQLYRNLTQ